MNNEMFAKRFDNWGDCLFCGVAPGPGIWECDCQKKGKDFQPTSQQLARYNQHHQLYNEYLAELDNTRQPYLRAKKAFEEQEKQLKAKYRTKGLDMP